MRGGATRTGAGWRFARAGASIAALVLMVGCVAAPTAAPPTASASPTVWVAPTLVPPTATASPAPPTAPPQATVAPTATALPAPTETTPVSTAIPAPEPTAVLAPQPVAVWEGSVTLATYGWEQALVPSTPDDPIYPYPRLNREAVAGPAPRTYGAVFIQNEYVQLVVLPEMGGRILRWTDRTTGRQLLYANPVVKPTGWGYRGWWFATGGIEWAFPTDEHGLNEYRAWQYEVLWNGVRVWDTDDRTGMTVEVAIQLEAGSGRVALTPRISNSTGEAHAYQFWSNAMLTLSDVNAPSPELRFVLPASEVIVHSSGDGALPGAGSAMAWPVYGGRDFSRYPTYTGWLGVFAPQAADAGFSGAYDLGTDQGIVRVAPGWVRGVKLFCLGNLDAGLWTDDGSRYVELWGGLTSTFWADATLEPGNVVSWTEYWYAVSGMGGYTYANAEGAVRLTPNGDALEVALITARLVQVTVVVRQGGAEVSRWQVVVGPGRPFHATSASGAGEAWGVQVVDEAGEVLVALGVGG